MECEVNILNRECRDTHLSLISQHLPVLKSAQIFFVVISVLLLSTESGRTIAKHLSSKSAFTRELLIVLHRLK